MALKGQKGSPRGEAGQILLVVILVIIVASTIGLSLASRSITSLRTSTEEAESQKALAAAEAGIERAIQGSIPISVSNPSVFDSEGKTNSAYNATVTQVDSSNFLINGGNVIPKDEGTDVWFVDHNSDNSPNYSDYSSTSPNFLNLYWGSSSDGACGSSTAPAAIQAIIITRNSSSPNAIKSYRYTYDICSRGNNFTLAQDNAEALVIDGVTLKYRTPFNSLASNIPGSKNIVLMRIIPIYKDAVVGIYACNKDGGSCTQLPSQGYKIVSTGKSGQANRKLTVFKGWPQTYLPYLSYGLFVAN